MKYSDIVIVYKEYLSITNWIEHKMKPKHYYLGYTCTSFIQLLLLNVGTGDNLTLKGIY